MHILRRFRQAKKMNQNAAAEFFGVSQTTISLIEKGKRSVTISMAKKMATDEETAGEFSLERILLSSEGNHEAA